MNRSNYKLKLKLKNISLYFFLGLCIFIMLSCKDNRGRQEIPFVAYVEIPAGLNNFYTYHFPAKVATNGLVPQNTIEAVPARMRASLEFGEPSFDFARRAFLDVFTSSGTAEMGYNNNILLTGQNGVDLYPSVFNMKDVINSDSFQVKLKLDLRTPTTLTSRVRIDFTLQITTES